MTEGPLAPWLADIAANILAVVLVVLIVTGLSERGSAPPVALSLTRVAPEGSAQIVALLRERLVGEAAAIDLARAGVQHVRDAAGEVLVSVFTARDHATILRGLRDRGLAWREITVPEALHASDGSGYSAAFLALHAEAEDPERFRSALNRLLSQPGARGTRGLIGDEDAHRGLAARMSDWGRVLAGLTMLMLVLAIRAFGRLANATAASGGGVRPDLA